MPVPESLSSRSGIGARVVLLNCSSILIELNELPEKLTDTEDEENYTRQKLKQQPRSPVRGLTVSQESRNFLGLFRYLSSIYVFANPRFLSIKRRNLLGFSCIKNMLRDQLFKTSGLLFDNSLFGPKTFLGPTNMS